MVIRLASVLVPVALCGWLFLSPHAFGVQEQAGDEPELAIVVIALTGVAAPGTDGTFSSITFFEPVINATGSIAFRANIEEGANTVEGGIWFSTPEVTSLVVLGGNEAPGPEFVIELNDGSTQQAEFGSFTATSPAINAFDGLAFVAEIAFKGNTIWRRLALGNLSLVLFDETAFGTDATLNEPKLDDVGNALFVSAVNGVSSLTRATDPGAFEFIVSEGDTLPDTGTAEVTTLFDDFTVNSTGIVTFTVGLEATNDRAVFIEQTGSFTLVVREGETVTVTGNGDEPTDVTLDIVLFPKINRRGEVIIFADNFTDAISSSREGIFVGTSRQNLALVVGTVGTTSTVKGNVVFDDLFSPALFNGNGDVLFEATTNPAGATVPRALWRRTVDGAGNASFDTVAEVGQDAPGTDSTFDSFDNMILNGSGQVAFRAELDDGVHGIWMEDPQGALTLVVREGQVLETNEGTLATVVSVFLTGDCGTEDGTPCGFSDQGDLVFTAVFDTAEFGADTEGILRATFGEVQPPEEEEGADFRWNQGAGNDDWHGETGGTTNWEDSEGESVDPPGVEGNETVTIQTNVPPDGVVLDQQDVQIGKLTASGKLLVRKSLTLNEESSVESLVLDSLESEIVANAKLTVTGADTLFQAGTLTINSDDGMVNEGTVTVEPFIVPLEAGLAFTRQLQPPPPQTVTFTGSGPFINAPLATFLQEFNVLVDGTGGIVNEANANWVMAAGNFILGPNASGEGPNAIGAKFTNRGTLIKPQGPDTSAESLMDLEYDGQEGSTIKVDKGTLTLRGGGTFRSADGKIELDDLTTLRLSSHDGRRKRYQISSGKLTAQSSNSETATMEIGDNAILSVAQGAEFVSKLRSNGLDSVQQGLLFKGTGELFVAGVFRNQRHVTWEGGKIETSEFATGAKIVNESLMVIVGASRKTLAGLLVADRTALVTQIASFTVDRGEIRNNGRWTISNRGESVIVDIAAGNGTALFTNNAFFSYFAGPASTSTIATRFNNVGQVVTDGGTVRFTGQIDQVNGDTLTGGAWTAIGDDGVIDLQGKTIKEIGNASGNGAFVFLRGGGVFERLALSAVNATGIFTIEEERFLISSKPGKFETPGALVNRGSVRVTGVNSQLTVNGQFDQFKKLTVGEDSKLIVNGGDLVLQVGSLTTVDGTITINTGGLKIRSALEGKGTINAETIEHILGRLKAGKSPGILTINGDYIQSAEAILEIDIGGTQVETQHAQLVVNGDADIAGGLVLKFIDDFSPRAGQTFDFLTVTGTQTGRLSNVEIVDLAPGFEFEVTPTEGGMMMTAITDGVFTGIIGEINDVTLGVNTPPDETIASPGDVDVPMLQFDVVPEADGLTINRLTLKASGTGNDLADLTGVTVWVDENENGRVEPELPAAALAVDGVDEEGIDLIAEGDRQIGIGTYDLDDGTLILTIDPPLELGPRETATLLVTYDFVPEGEGEAPADSAKRPRSGMMPMLGVGMIALSSLLLIGLVGVRRRRNLGTMCCAVMVAVFCLSGCDGQTGGTPAGGDGNGESGGGGGDKTFQITLTAVGATEAGTGLDATVEGLALAGTTLTLNSREGT